MDDEIMVVSNEFKQIAHDIMSKDVFRETVSKSIQNDGQKVLDAIFNEDIETLKHINNKYGKEAGRNQGGGGAGPGKVKQPRRGAEPVFNASLIAINGFKELKNTMPTLDPATIKYNEDKQRHNDMAAEHVRLRNIGLTALPGIRFQDAAEVGRVWESKLNGDLTNSQWEDYKRDLEESGKVSAMTRQDAETKPPFSDEYSGQRYKYGFRNRPYNVATCPKGNILMTYKPEDKEHGSRHGTIEYPFQLTKDDVYNYELVDFTAIKQQENDFQDVMTKLSTELEARNFIILHGPLAVEYKTELSHNAMKGTFKNNNALSIQLYQNYEGYVLKLNLEGQKEIFLDYDKPEQIDINRSLKWIDKELAKESLKSLNALEPDFAQFVLKQDQGHIEGYSPKETILHLDSTAKGLGLDVQWTYEDDSIYGPIAIAGFTTSKSRDIAGAHISKDGKAIFFMNGERLKGYNATEYEETQTLAINDIAKTFVKSNNYHAVYEKDTGKVIAVCDGSYEALKLTMTNRENLELTYCGETINEAFQSGQTIIRNESGVMEIESDPEKTLRELWTKQGVSKERQDELIADVTAKAQPGAYVGPFRIGGESIELLESNKIRTLALAFAKPNNNLPVSSYAEVTNLTGLTKEDQDKYWSTAKDIAAKALMKSELNNGNKQYKDIEYEINFHVHNYIHGEPQVIYSKSESKIKDEPMFWSEATGFGALSYKTTSFSRKQLETFTLPGNDSVTMSYSEARNIASNHYENSVKTHTTQPTNGGNKMEITDNDTVQASTEFKTTGARLTEKLEYQVKSLTKEIGYHEFQLKRLLTMPEIITKVDKKSGETTETSRYKELEGISKTEAINAMSKGEYVRNMIIMKKMNEKKKIEPWSVEDKAKYIKAVDRNARLFKEAHHPEKKDVLEKAMKKAFFFNCTEDGLNKQIESVKQTLENTTKILAKVKELPEHEFAIKIKGQLKLSNLKYDANFNQQLETAIAAKNAPAPAPEKKKPAARKR